MKNKGLFYKYNNLQELDELLNVFGEVSHIRNLYIFHEDILMLIEEFKACFNYLEAGGGLVFNSKGEFLVIERNGIWDLPKGKLEKGEDFETAALREVEEETGLKELQLIHPVISTYHTYMLNKKRMLKKTRWFEMNYTGTEEPDLQSEEGISDFRWVRPGATDFIRQNTYKSIMDVLYFKKLI